MLVAEVGRAEAREPLELVAVGLQPGEVDGRLVGRGAVVERRRHHPLVEEELGGAELAEEHHLDVARGAGLGGGALRVGVPAGEVEGGDPGREIVLEAQPQPAGLDAGEVLGVDEAGVVVEIAQGPRRPHEAPRRLAVPGEGGERLRVLDQAPHGIDAHLVEGLAPRPGGDLVEERRVGDQHRIARSQADRARLLEHDQHRAQGLAEVADEAAEPVAALALRARVAVPLARAPGRAGRSRSRRRSRRRRRRGRHPAHGVGRGGTPPRCRARARG